MKIDTFPHFVFGCWRHEKLPPFGKFRRPAEIFFIFFAEMLRKHLMHSAKSRLSLRMERALRSGRWDSFFCGKQPLNILEVVGLRAPTAVAECHRHSAKSRLSLRMERALRIWAVGFHLLRQATIKYFRGCRPTGSHGGCRRATGTSAKEPPFPSVWRAGAEIWAVGFLFCGKATAVETCHWHVSKSRLSNPTFGKK